MLTIHEVNGCGLDEKVDAHINACKKVFSLSSLFSAFSTTLDNTNKRTTPRSCPPSFFLSHLSAHFSAFKMVLLAVQLKEETKDLHTQGLRSKFMR